MGGLERERAEGDDVAGLQLQGEQLHGEGDRRVRDVAPIVVANVFE
jgi:hypothetical protein